MGRYEFTTVWRLDVPRDRVWDALHEAEAYVRWWPGFEEVEVLEPGGPDRSGMHTRLVTRSRLPYRLRFETVNRDQCRPDYIVLDAVGELTGSGRWELASQDGITTVTYRWEVKTSKAWMDVVEPLLRPLLVWNHHLLMARGGEGLARELGGTMIDQQHLPALRPRDWAPLVGFVATLGLLLRRRASR